MHPTTYLLKLACTDVSLLIDTRQVGEEPEQAPLQPRNDFPSGGVAVKMTVVPCVNLAEQALPQLNRRSLPVGVADTTPGLLRPTESVNCEGRKPRSPATTCWNCSMLVMSAPPANVNVPAKFDVENDESFEPRSLTMHVAFGDGEQPATAFPLHKLRLAELLRR